MNKTIHELSSLSEAEATDEMIVYDVSSNESKKIPIKKIAGDYSETETLTGATWIDGKPIYRKVVDCGALPNNTSKTVAHNIANLGRIINICGIAKDTSDGTEILLPYIDISTISNSVQIYFTSTYISIRTNTNRSAYNETYITLEYTKTT